MNIYEKLQKCRVELQSKGLNKSGNNKFAGYTYFELSDFLPTINQMCLDHKLMTQTSFTNELATLKIINVEAPEEVIEFTSPMASAQLKGCHDIQNLGAVETYQRRYLLVTAFEIVENDALDPLNGKDDKPKNNGNDSSSPKKLSEAQLKRMYAIAKTAGYDANKVVKGILSRYNCKPENMTKQQYDEVCSGYEKLGAQNGN